MKTAKKWIAAAAALAAAAQLMPGAVMAAGTYNCDFSQLIKNGADTYYGTAADVIELDANTTAYLTYEGSYAAADGKVYLTGGNNSKGAYNKGSYIEFTAPSAGTVSIRGNVYNYAVGDATYTGYQNKGNTFTYTLNEGQKLRVGQRTTGNYIESLSFEPSESEPGEDVSTVTVVYKLGSETVCEKTVETGDGYSVGSSYTYISDNYVKGTDGTIYAVGNDYTEDTASPVILNSSSNPVNSQLRQTVTLEENTTIEYSVTRSPGAVFYGEWEDILSTTASGYATGRYIASGGKMTTTTAATSFYEIPETGYYQIVLMGGPVKRGTAIFATATAAELAASAADGLELLNISSSTSNANYGIYSAKTALLKKGDDLTIRGFGSSNTSDNLDYVLVRRVYTNQIYGADGVSAVQGGQTAQYWADVDADNITWSVTGTSGVTIDSDGTLTVAPDAAAGTAVITASANGNGYTKSVAIAPAQIADFELSGASVIELGGTAKYAAASVKDQYGSDITGSAAVSFSSSAPEILNLSPDGIAQSFSDGTAQVTVTVTVNGSEMSKSVDVTAGIYSVRAGAEGDSTTVDTSSLPKGGSISRYLVTTATRGGILVKQTTTGAGSSVTADTKNAEVVEVTPIYSCGAITRDGYTLPDNIPDGVYNMTFTKANTSRADIYANGVMLGNDIDRAGYTRSVSTPAVYKVPDVNITGGSINIQLVECGSAAALSGAEIAKAPSVVRRKTKITVIGGALAAAYYGDRANKDLGANGHGWGERLYRFLDTARYDIVDLAAADEDDIYVGAYRAALANSAEGDIIICECDGSVTYADIASMAAAASEQGVELVLATKPIDFAAAQSYSTSADGSELVRSAAERLGIRLLDLNEVTYNYISSLYGADFETAKAKYAKSYGIGDGTRLSFAGATKLAELAAKCLRDTGAVKCFNLQYEYRTNDPNGGTIYANMNDSGSYTAYTTLKTDDSIGITVLPGETGTAYAVLYDAESTAKAVTSAALGGKAKTLKFARPAGDGYKMKLMLTDEALTAAADTTVVYDEDGKTLYITAPDGTESAVMIIAGYEGERFKRAEKREISFTGSAAAVDNIELGEADRLYIWNDTEHMTPLTEVYTKETLPRVRVEVPENVRVETDYIEADYISVPESDYMDNMRYGYYDAAESIEGDMSYSGGMNYRYYLPVNYDSDKDYPIVMYLHGAGRRGSDNNDQLINGQYIVNSLLSSKYLNNEATQCIIINPQCPSGKSWAGFTTWSKGSYSMADYARTQEISQAHDIMLTLAEKYGADMNRLYLAGQSMGGYGTWKSAAEYPDFYAAIVPLCGGGPTDEAGAGAIAAVNMPVWAFHGSSDSTVPVSGSREMVAALEAFGDTKVNYTELEGRNHEIQGEVFTTTAAEVGLYEWLFEQTKTE